MDRGKTGCEEEQRQAGKQPASKQMSEQLIELVLVVLQSACLLASLCS